MAPDFVVTPGMSSHPLLSDVLAGRAKPLTPATAAREDVESGMATHKRIQERIAQCEHRGEQIQGPKVGGCGCHSTWRCAMGKGLPLTPNEVSFLICFQCVQERKNEAEAMGASA